MELITGEVLQKIAVTPEGVKLNITRAGQMASLLNSICTESPYFLNTIDIFHEFLATILEESDCFRRKVENMNYTHAEVIVKTWPTRFKNTMVAAPYVSQPQKLANYVYGKRLGNTGDNDGWLCRGSSFIQITGRQILQLYYDFIKPEMSFDALVEKIRNEDGWALNASSWYYSVYKKLIKLSIDDRFLDITKVVNGGFNGLNNRIRYYNLAKQFLILK